MTGIYCYLITIAWLFTVFIAASPRGSFLSHTVTDIVKKNPSLSKLQSLLRKTELGFKLDQSRDLTFLAPDNEAIDEMSFDEIGGNYLNYKDTMQILSNHVIPEVVRIGELPEGIHEYETLAGSTIAFQVTKKKSVVEENPTTHVVVYVKNDRTAETTTSRKTQLTASAPFDNVKAVEVINGLVYTMSTLLIPDNLKSVVDNAKKTMESSRLPREDRRGERGGITTSTVGAGDNDESFGVPEHVQENNRNHWSQKDSRVVASDAGVHNQVEIVEPVLESNTLITESAEHQDIGVLNL